MICQNTKCGKEHDGNFASGRYCSISCSHSRIHSQNTKNKTSKSLTGRGNSKVELICKNCLKLFIVEYKMRKAKFCSRSCNSCYTHKLYPDLMVKAGRLSAQSRVLRSKNEIHFYNLCKDKFKDVTSNEMYFNGWDADVIIHDIKYAILWNGVWHYDKVGKNHSLKQVQNRDRIKLIEITKLGYKPYIVKDMGRENKSFVIEQFRLFLESL